MFARMLILGFGLTVASVSTGCEVHGLYPAYPVTTGYGYGYGYGVPVRSGVRQVVVAPPPVRGAAMYAPAPVIVVRPAAAPVSVGRISAPPAYAAPAPGGGYTHPAPGSARIPSGATALPARGAPIAVHAPAPVPAPTRPSTHVGGGHAGGGHGGRR